MDDLECFTPCQPKKNLGGLEFFFFWTEDIVALYGIDHGLV